jgi:hypothetical protein
VRLSHAQRNVVYVMAAFFALALAIGLWPVHADVFGDPSYSCGSGFVHSAHQWKVDSASSINNRTAGSNDATGTPSQVCPNKVFGRRDFALLVAGFALVVGLLTLVLIQRPPDRSSTALQASLRVRDSGRR